MNRRVPLGRVAAIVLAVMVAACEETLTSRQRESLLDAGDQALMEGRLDEAAQSFRRVVEAGSADARPYAGLGLAQMRSRRSREALESFQEATRRAPDNPHYAQLEAHVLATLGRTDEAITAFDRLLAKDPAQPRAAVELIDLLLASGRQKDAVAVARVASEHSPRDFNLLMRAAALTAAEGAPQEALGYYKAAREVRPYSADAVRGIIRMMREVGLTEQANALVPLYKALRSRAREIERLREAAATSVVDPQPARTYVQRLFEEGWLDVAMRETHAFLTQFPDDPDGGMFAVRAAQAGILTGEDAEARAFAGIARRHGPRTTEEIRGLALVYNALGDYDIALPLFERRLEADPNDVQALSGLGRALVATGDLDRARVILRQALDLQPDRPEALAGMGLLLIKGGYLEEAERSLQRAIRAEPAQADALFGLGVLAQQRRKLEEAEDYLRRAIDARPGDIDARMVLAIVLTDQQRCEEAIPIFTKVLETDYDNMALHAGLIRCYEATGRQAEADAARRIATELLGEPPASGPAPGQAEPGGGEATGKTRP